MGKRKTDIRIYILVLVFILIITQMEIYWTMEELTQNNVRTARNEDIIRAIGRGANFTLGWTHENGRIIIAEIFQIEGGDAIYCIENRHWDVNTWNYPVLGWVNITWDYFTLERISITHDMWGWSDDVNHWVEVQYYAI